MVLFCGRFEAEPEGTRKVGAHSVDDALDRSGGRVTARGAGGSQDYEDDVCALQSIVEIQDEEPGPERALREAVSRCETAATVAGLDAHDLHRAARASAVLLADVSALAAARGDVELPVATGHHVSDKLAFTPQS